MKTYILLFLFLVSLFQTQSFAMNQIIRPYQSVRSAGMGGVRLTTGLYDENFFNNPARVTANPDSKFTILQMTPVETTSNTINAINSIGSSTNNGLDTISTWSGKNLHNRTQLILPAYYYVGKEDTKYSLAVGMIASLQADANLRQSYQTSFGGIADIGPAITYGRKFLEDDSLSAGITGHFIYRMAAAPNYSILDYVRGQSLSVSSIGAEGATFDFDIGTMYKIKEFGPFVLNVGGAIQNILGGDYSRISMKFFKLNNAPPSQSRSYGLGTSLTRSTWWVLHDTSFAFEVTDVLNSPNGSVYKLLHLGGETHWKSLAFRLGLNQGYICAGLGLDVHYFTLDLVTYGEELGLNAGQFEDRRYALSFGFHI